MWRETRGLWTQKKVFRVRGRRREGEMKKGDIVEGGGCQSVLCPPPAYFPSGSSKRKVGENRKNLKGSRIFLPFSPSSPVFVFSCLCFSFFPFLLSSHISVKFSSRFRPASLTWGMSLYTLLLQPPPTPVCTGDQVPRALEHSPSGCTLQGKGAASSQSWCC